MESHKCTCVHPCRSNPKTVQREDQKSPARKYDYAPRTSRHWPPLLHSAPLFSTQSLLRRRPGTLRSPQRTRTVHRAGRAHRQRRAASSPVLATLDPLDVSPHTAAQYDAPLRILSGLSTTPSVLQTPRLPPLQRARLQDPPRHIRPRRSRTPPDQCRQGSTLRFRCRTDRIRRRRRPPLG